MTTATLHSLPATPAEASDGRAPELGVAPCSVVWLRTVSRPYFYVHELRGVCFVSFVAAGDTGYAACFPIDKAPVETWRKVVGSIAGCELEAITPGSQNT